MRKAAFPRAMSSMFRACSALETNVDLVSFVSRSVAHSAEDGPASVNGCSKADVEP
jgi:hypothetical protein